MLLAGDIGGTNTRLGLFVPDGEGIRQVTEKTYPSQDFPSLSDILRAFLGGTTAKVEQICLGIAGPVRHGRVVTSNLPWELDEKQLQADLGSGPVALLNDLEANAHGLRALRPDDLAVLNPGTPEKTGNAALISAGTGLGEAGLFWDGKRRRPCASEGGHADFAPRGTLERELAAYLAARFDHVSYERVLSGPGLYNIYCFLQDRGGQPDELPAVMRELGTSDASAAISQAGLSGQNVLCLQALEMFISIYAAEAGNLALKFLATYGVYLGGGIAPKILPLLRSPTFMQAFTAKGRMHALLGAIPVRVVLNEQTALLGAAWYAAGL
jgi:glucokinase